MKTAYRYNELDELAWEAEHGCVDEPYGDECWDEACARICPETAQIEDFDLDDETGAGIFGNEFNQSKNAKPTASACISNGKLFGHGEADDILSVISTLLEPDRDYHFEFGFFEAK